MARRNAPVKRRLWESVELHNAVKGASSRERAGGHEAAGLLIGAAFVGVLAPVLHHPLRIGVPQPPAMLDERTFVLGEQVRTPAPVRSGEQLRVVEADLTWVGRGQLVTSR